MKCVEARRPESKDTSSHKCKKCCAGFICTMIRLILCIKVKMVIVEKENVVESNYS